MDCHWCGGGLNRLADETITQKFDQALARGDEAMFESAMNDLMHALYHKTRASLDHDDAMDVVLDAMKQLWAWWNRNHGPGTV